jgi:hypothetical protein
MSFKSYHQTVVEKVALFFDQIVEKRWQTLPDQPTDDLYLEIYRLEKRLSRTQTRPLQISRQIEPITEQQKIMDMSG